jgi:hypothetical protein
MGDAETTAPPARRQPFLTPTSTLVWAWVYMLSFMVAEAIVPNAGDKPVAGLPTVLLACSYAAAVLSMPIAWWGTVTMARRTGSMGLLLVAAAPIPILLVIAAWLSRGRLRAMGKGQGTARR